MTSGLCTAAVTLIEEEQRYLEDLPEAMIGAPEADGCCYKAGHQGPHAFLAQVQQLDDDGPYTWVVWEGPEQPDSQGYEFKTMPPCWEPKPGGIASVDDCRLPRGHNGDHRW